jgi:hypothetical protein
MLRSGIHDSFLSAIIKRGLRVTGRGNIGNLKNPHFIPTAGTTDMTTSHLTNPAKDTGQVIGYSHSTRLPKNGNQVAGYAALRKNFLLAYQTYAARRNFSAPCIWANFEFLEAPFMNYSCQ